MSEAVALTSRIWINLDNISYFTLHSSEPTAEVTMNNGKTFIVGEGMVKWAFLKALMIENRRTQNDQDGI